MLETIGNVLMWLATAAVLLLFIPALYLVSNRKLFSTISLVLRAFFLKINGYIFKSVMWLALFMALVQLAVVIMRYTYGINFIWLQESIIYMFAFLFLLTSGQALLDEEHVRVDIFYREASPRRKAIVDFVGTYLFLFPVCILIIWGAAPYVARAWADQQGSNEASGIQAVFLLKTLIPLFATLVAMAGFSISTRAAHYLRGREV